MTTGRSLHTENIPPCLVVKITRIDAVYHANSDYENVEVKVRIVFDMFHGYFSGHIVHERHSVFTKIPFTQILVIFMKLTTLRCA